MKTNNKPEDAQVFFKGCWFKISPPGKTFRFNDYHWVPSTFSADTIKAAIIKEQQDRKNLAQKNLEYSVRKIKAELDSLIRAAEFERDRRIHEARHELARTIQDADAAIQRVA